MMAEIVGPFDWGRSKVRPDPITGRYICKDCWDSHHGTAKVPTCQRSDCRCACKEAPENQRQERVRRQAAKRARRKLLREMRDAEDNPLRAIKEPEENKSRKL